MSIPEFINIPFVKDLGTQLVNNLSTTINKATGKAEQDLRLYQRKNLDFRQIIDTSFPSLLIIDYTRIKAELKKYQDLPRNLQEVIGLDYNPTESDYSVNKLSNKEIDLILDVIKASVTNLSNEADKQTSISLQQKLQSIIATENQSNVLNQVSSLFNKLIELKDLRTSNRSYFIFPTFESIRGIFTKYITINLELIEAQSNFLFTFKNLSELLNYGHTATAAKVGENKYKIQFNSPKLLAIIFDVVNETNTVADPVEKINQATVKFLEETRQLDVSIDIEKDFADGFMSLFVAVGGNVLTFENTIINQRKGSVLEKKSKLGLNKVVLLKLANQFKNLGKTALGSGIIQRISTGRSSPSPLDYMIYNIVQNIKGQKVQKFKQKTNSTKTTTTKKKVPVVSGFIKPGTKKDIFPKKAKQKLPKNNIVLAEAETNLVSLQNLINSLLHEQIRQNMGDGNRRDVLNYRTGRFAESARVEQLTQGRSGMITAYYTYMKYPYATFSTGGEQEFPRSRDPKLLISQSIREIAQQQMITRMRAQLI